MRSAAFLIIFAASSLSACASTPGIDDDLGASADESTSRDGGKTTTTKDAGSTSKDAGKTTSSSGSSSSGSSSSGSSSSGSSSSKDAGSTTKTDASASGLPDLSGILGGFTGGSSSSSDAGTKPKIDGGTVDSCENLVCFDVFDCALWHSDKLDCGFTACTAFVCTK